MNRSPEGATDGSACRPFGASNAFLFPGSRGLHPWLLFVARAALRSLPRSRHAGGGLPSGLRIMTLRHLLCLSLALTLSPALRAEERPSIGLTAAKPGTSPGVEVIGLPREMHAKLKKAN